MPPKIALCCLRIGEGYQELTKLSLLTHTQYCEKQGYTYINCTQSLDPTKPPHWSKMLLLLKHMGEYDYIVWIDADMHIMNPDIRIETFLEDEKDLMVGSDTLMTNTGFMVFRNCEWCREFLKTWFGHKGFKVIGNFEQDSFQDLLAKNIDDCMDHIRILEPRDANSYFWNYRYGDFILHFASCRGWQISSSLEQFCPVRKPDDTDEVYEKRMKVIREMNQHKPPNAMVWP